MKMAKAKKVKKPQTKWASRNKVLKVLKSTDEQGWLHLYIAQRIDNQKTFIRLKKYMNWFSIPSPKHLLLIQDMLKQGAEEIGWAYKDISNFKIDIETGENLDYIEKESFLGEIPDEIIDFMENFPEFVPKILALKISNDDLKYIIDLVNLLEDSIIQSGARFKTAFKEVIEKISEQDTQGIQELSDLMKSWNLLKITSITSLIKNRLETIETFEQMIHDDRTYEINTENSIHRLLEKSMWLVDENYWISQSNRSLRNFIGDEIIKQHKEFSQKRPDFACVDHESKLIILEIKRPSIELTKKELDQAELYQRLIKRYKSQTYKSIDVYLIGNKISNEALEIAELRKGITIKTYDDLLENCRKRYKKYLDIIENQE
jgi:hypothetical protein